MGPPYLLSMVIYLRKTMANLRINYCFRTTNSYITEQIAIRSLGTKNMTWSTAWSIVVGLNKRQPFLQPLPHYLAALHHTAQINSEGLPPSPKVAPAYPETYGSAYGSSSHTFKITRLHSEWRHLRKCGTHMRFQTYPNSHKSTVKPDNVWRMPFPGMWRRVVLVW
jgi:hypothetical protein